MTKQQEIRLEQLNSMEFLTPDEDSEYGYLLRLQSYEMQKSIAESLEKTTLT